MNMSSLATAARRWFAISVVAMMILATLPGFVAAQTTSSNMRGQVVGDDDEPIAGAQVMILHQPSGTVSRAATGPTGQFFQSGLRVGGPYEVRVSSDGYQTVAREGVYLEPGSQDPFRFELAEMSAELGAVQVTGVALSQAVVLNNGVGSTFSARDIANQPSVERDVIKTLLRDPLAQSDGEGQLSVAGVNPRFNGLAIDGSLQQDDFGLSDSTYATARSPINLDAVESATLVASDYSVTATGFTGGLVNVVTKSGTNEIDGNIYYAYRDEDFVGNNFDGGRFEPAEFDEEEYGFTLGGPILKDKLFFFVSYDEFDASTPVDFARGDEQDGIDPAIFGELNQIIQDSLGFDAQGRPLSASVPETSERTLVKLDWNINDDHRASVTWQDTEEDGTLGVGNNNFESAFYDTPTKLESYGLQLFSDWSYNFSTTFRANFKEFERGQNCRAGPDVGELRIRLRPEQLVGTDLEGMLAPDTGQTTLTAGCDRFRHANDFSDERLQLFLSGDYFVGNHVITAGAEWEDYDLFNLFVERSRGRFTFDSLDDLIAGDAAVEFRSVPSLEPNDAAAAWGYEKLSLFAGDRWAITPDFELSYGLRYERFIQDDEPLFSQDIQNRFGVDTRANLDENDLIMPRVGFLWTPFARTAVSGGVGLFAGGNPQVWISNAFQPPTSLVSGNFSNVDPSQIPQELLDMAAVADTTVIDVIDEGFDTPSDWKGSLRVEQGFDLNIGGLELGRNYRFTAQYLYTRTNKGFRWQNLAQTDLADALPIGTAPDGRPIFADLQDLGISNLTQLTNFDNGESHVATVAVGKAFESGFNFDVSYAFQDIEAVTEGGSSRGISSFRGIDDINPNDPSARISPFEVRNSFKFNFGYERAFVSNLVTRLDVFGRLFSGDVWTPNFDIDSNNALFGRPGDGESPFDNRPLYIPDPVGDARTVFGSGFDQAGFFSFIEENGFSTGQIAKVHSRRSSWNNIWDLRFQQELPGIPGLGRLVGDNRFKVVLDIENFANLINSDWGAFKEGPGFTDLPLVRADLVSAADVAANGIDDATALTGDAPRLACQQQSDCLFRFNSFRERDTSFTVPEDSVYRIRLTLRYDF
ncbi:MAG: TonB-dependent receptor [Wenzhouxiangellaceae bacterium]|nr:TonB-dependent receptor [Wenzhouxiangellaceae bacterium]